MASTLIVLQSALTYIQDQRKVLDDLGAIKPENDIPYVKICEMIIKEVTRLITGTSGRRQPKLKEIQANKEFAETTSEDDCHSEGEITHLHDEITYGIPSRKKARKSEPDLTLQNYSLTLVDAEDLNNKTETKDCEDKNAKAYKYHECDFCAKRFNSNITLDKHIKGFHLNDKPFGCDICGKCFVDKTKLNRHIKIHDEVKCDYCEKTFKSETKLQEEHLYTHTGETPFECDICNKQFAVKSTMNRHKANHGNERSHCVECNIKFPTSDEYKKHLFSMAHGAGDDGRFHCDFCEKTFKQRGHMKRHRLIHTGDKPFKCDVCFKRFSRNDDRNKHVLTQHSYPVQKQMIT